jgi:hypothetical protein
MMDVKLKIRSLVQRFILNLSYSLALNHFVSTYLDRWIYKVVANILDKEWPTTIVR